jgi:hypothetical protein
MATKFPLEMITTLSNAPDYSPVIWNGTDLVVATDNDYNLKSIVATLDTVKTEFANFLANNQPALQEVILLSADVGAIKPKITVFESQVQVFRFSAHKP